MTYSQRVGGVDAIPRLHVRVLACATLMSAGAVRRQMSGRLRAWLRARGPAGALHQSGQAHLLTFIMDRIQRMRDGEERGK